MSPYEAFYINDKSFNNAQFLALGYFCLELLVTHSLKGFLFLWPDASFYFLKSAPNELGRQKDYSEEAKVKVKEPVQL